MVYIIIIVFLSISTCAYMHHTVISTTRDTLECQERAGATEEVLRPQAWCGWCLCGWHKSAEEGLPKEGMTWRQACLPVVGPIHDQEVTWQGAVC